MTGLVFVGMVGPDSHNPEEQRFVEELSRSFDVTYYLRGAGIKGLRWHQILSLPARLMDRSFAGPVRHGSLFVVPLRRLARGLNAWWIQWQLRKLIGNLHGSWTIWIRFPSPELVDAVEGLRGVRLVYEPIDLYAAGGELSGGESRRLAAAEERLTRKATVITGGRQLAELFAHAPDGSTWLPFGLDEHQSTDGPGVPAAIPTPRLVLVGCLDWRVDESLLLSVMRERPDWHLVLAGPRVRPWGRRLKALPNVHWMGRIPVERVRPIIRDCDVALIPYRQTEWTRHCLPVKVFEYLAEGKPVVATRLPELALLGEAVSIATPAMYAAAIERAMLDGDQAAAAGRRQVAERFTLQNRARRAVDLLRGRVLEVATL